MTLPLARFFASLILFWVFLAPATAQEISSVFPRFRQSDSTAPSQAAPVASSVVLLADEEFAPWSFKGEDGNPRGISVDLALAACRAAKLSCTLKLLPFSALLPGLEHGEADAIITGLRLDQGLATKFRTTRPYFLSLGRFAARLGAPLSSTDVRALAGKRIGFAKNSAHGAFLTRYYSKSQLVGFETADQAFEALRTGALDTVFADAIQLSYWLAGSNSKNCCQALGKAYVDRQSFSRELVFLVAAGRENLRDILDGALDNLEARGDTAKLFNTYLPGPIW